jgi:hypothetical protein
MPCQYSLQAEAQTCIDEMHGKKHLGKKLKVELQERNHENRKPVQQVAPLTISLTISGDAAADRRARSVRLEGLPKDTQEGLLQQALEKVVPVTRLQLFNSDNHAVAELQSAAVSLKLSGLWLTVGCRHPTSA